MLTPSTLTVNFTANYAGSHRICWRIQGPPVVPYVCTNIVDCIGGGNVCSATISIMVDTDSCIPVTYEGYIQATCNPEGSPVDQVLWSYTYTADPACKLFALTCNTVLNQPCGVIPSASLGLNCNGTVRPDIGPITNNGTVFLCATNPIPNLPADYTMTLAPGCCFDCSQHTIDVFKNCPTCILDGASVYYLDCTTRELIRIDLSGDGPYNLVVCAVTDSVYLELTPETAGTISAAIPCP